MSIRLHIWALALLSLSACNSPAGPGPQYPPLPNLEVLEGEWEHKASFTDRYYCTSGECHWYVGTDTGSVEVIGSADVFEGPARIGPPLVVRTDTFAFSGVIMTTARANLVAEVTSWRRCSQSATGVLVSCFHRTPLPGPNSVAYVEVTIARNPGEQDVDVRMSVNYDGDDIFDGSLSPTGPDWNVFVSDSVAFAPDGWGWLLVRTR